MASVTPVMAVPRLAWVVLSAVCVALSSASCSGHSAGFTDAGKFSKTPDSCALLPPALAERLTGATVAGERVDDKAVAAAQECSWMKVADASHPDAKFGQVTVFVHRGEASSADNAVQSIDKLCRQELSKAGCVPLRDLAVDQSCVFPGNGISLVA
jgi:hypothetical protein